MYQLNKGNQFGLKRSSQTFPSDALLKILGNKDAYVAGHFEYPAAFQSRHGSHLDAIYLAEPITADSASVDDIAEDLSLWLTRENIDFDVIFAPDDESSRLLATKISEKHNKRRAFWTYLPSGWLGGKMSSGELKKEDKVLCFAAVDMNGRTVGETLPKLVEQSGGITTGIAVFCKGTGGGVIPAEHKFGKRFYASIQAHIGLRPANDCPMCQMDNPILLKQWNES